MSIEAKTRRILTLFLVAFLAILLKVWHLEVIQREEKLLEAQKPQQKTILIRADRGTISDRFNIPMALNRIAYNATIYYAQIAQIPSIAWKGEGKTYARKEYIRELSQILAKMLNLDAERVEDLIHSKAALFPHVPYVIKANLSEEEHYQLRMLEKDWPGIYAEIASVRSYPLGKTGCNMIGTMGAISQKEYMQIAQELTDLQMKASFFDWEDTGRLAELKEKAYAINDSVGKMGIEAQFEEELRGYFGKKTFEVDQKGKFIREVAVKEAIPGKHITLSISSELQQFAEELLMRDEKTRDGRSLGVDPVDKLKKPLKQPWIKGGAIVALDPKTGEVLAMASYPRFDPNDFIKATPQVNRWLENRQFIASLWDGTEYLTRERNHKEEEQPLTWEFYLDQIISKEGPLRTFFTKLDDVKGAIQLQEDYEAMLYFTKNGMSVPVEIQRRLDAIHLSPQDKLFAVDLCRMAVYAPSFTDELIQKIGSMKLSAYRNLSQAFFRQAQEIRQKAEKQFHSQEFKEWKKREEKNFLKEKRKEEKENKVYARPYIDYLDKKEKELFAQYWEENRLQLLVNQEFSEDLIRTFRSFSELNRLLLGKYKKRKTEQDLAAAFYPDGGFGFSRSYAFEAAAPQGSIFKLVTGFEGLRQGKSLTIIDELTPKGVAHTLNGAHYPRFYKGGRLPRSAAASVGKIDLAGALEQTSNPYFSILAGDYFDDPEDLARAASLFGYGERTGIELPGEKKGNVPSDLKTNRTGLYSTAIGQHTLLCTPLQTSVMLASLVNGGKILKPTLVKESNGQTPDRKPLAPFAGGSYFAKEELSALGIFYPLFTGANLSLGVDATAAQSVEIKRTVPLDDRIRNPLLEGMERVVWGVKGSARPSSIRALLANPIWMREYLALQHQFIGKTGTAELVCNFGINPSSIPQMYKYVWFGGISFHDLHHEDPELVVVVFLRFADAGKEAAPLAAQMVHKWREIQRSAASLEFRRSSK
jgi:cell division protein FtsI/penicillin-binding protein 2